MKIHITSDALKWFKEEIDVHEGDMIKFYSKIYGNSPVQPGYSLAFTRDNTPLNIAVSEEIDGIIFYVEETDVWFFDGHDLHVDYDPKVDEIIYTYSKTE